MDIYYDLSHEISFIRHALLGHSRGPDRICLSSDGIRAVTYDSCGRDPSIYMWDIDAGEDGGYNMDL